MSTSPPTPPNPPATQSPSGPNEVTVVSHSSLLYWWPVWLCGFLMAIITAWEGTLMATVPPHTRKAVQTVDVDGKGKEEKREILIAPPELKDARVPFSQLSDPDKPGDTVHGSKNKSLGVIFFTVLLFVIAADLIRKLMV